MQQTTVAAPTWFRSSAEVTAFRAEKQRLYDAYRAASECEERAFTAGDMRAYHAAVERADAAWTAYCAHVDRGI